MQGLLNKGHQLFFDNFYTYLPLSEYLLTNGTGVCGNLRANRIGIPEVLKSAKVPKGQFAFRRKGKLGTVKLHDRKVVYLLYIMHNVSTMRTRKRSREGQHISRLRLTKEYNVHMGGVDKNDVMVATHSAVCKTLKWYKKLTFHFIEEALQNAYIAHSKSTVGKPNHYIFLREVVRALLLAADEEEIATAVTCPGVQERLVGQHVAEKIPSTKKKAVRMQACVVCHVYRRRRETFYVCGIAPGALLSAWCPVGVSTTHKPSIE